MESIIKKIEDTTFELIKDLTAGDYLDGITDAVRDAMGIVKNVGHLKGEEKKAFVVAGFKSAIDHAQKEGYLTFIDGTIKMLLYSLLPSLIDLAYNASTKGLPDKE